MARPLLLLMLYLAVTTAQAGPEWTKEEKEIQAAYIIVTTIDMLQTRHIYSTGDFSESNPLLTSIVPDDGKPGRVDQASMAIIAGMIVHTVIADSLSHKWRKRWQYIWLTIETEAVARNASLGIRLDF